MTPASRHSPTTSWTGWSVPTSWLPHWQCTSAGRGAASVRQALPEGLDVEPTLPVDADASRSAPARAEASRTAECSTAAQSTGAPGAARVAPQTAALMASVAPEVKTTWRAADAEQVRHLCPCRLERVADGAALFVEPAGIAGRKRGPVAPARRGLRAAAGVVLAWSR